MNKNSVTYTYPILIGSIILQNSKVHMYEYLYKIYPKIFGVNNINILYMGTDSIYAKLKNINHDQYKKRLEENKKYFSSQLGGMEAEMLDNPIQEFISISSKFYSHVCKNDIKANENLLKNNVVHTKGISDFYRNKHISHELFKQTLINNNELEKIKFQNIKVKNQNLFTNAIQKNNIEFLNDRRYISDINTNIPHTLKIE